MLKDIVPFLTKSLRALLGVLVLVPMLVLRVLGVHVLGVLHLQTNSRCMFHQDSSSILHQDSVTIINQEIDHFTVPIK